MSPGSAHRWSLLHTSHDRFDIAGSRCASPAPGFRRSAHNSTLAEPEPVAPPTVTSPGAGIAVAEDRAVVNIVAVIGIISVGRIPPAAIPIPVTATVTDEAVIVAPPPIAVVPLPPIPALRRTIRPLIPSALETAYTLFCSIAHCCW